MSDLRSIVACQLTCSVTHNVKIKRHVNLLARIEEPDHSIAHNRHALYIHNNTVGMSAIIGYLVNNAVCYT